MNRMYEAEAERRVNRVAATLGDACPSRTQRLAVLITQNSGNAPLIAHENAVDSVNRSGDSHAL